MSQRCDIGGALKSFLHSTHDGVCGGLGGEQENQALVPGSMAQQRRLGLAGTRGRHDVPQPVTLLQRRCLRKAGREAVENVCACGLPRGPILVKSHGFLDDLHRLRRPMRHPLFRVRQANDPLVHLALRGLRPVQL